MSLNLLRTYREYISSKTAHQKAVLELSKWPSDGHWPSYSRGQWLDSINLNPTCVRLATETNRFTAATAALQEVANTMNPSENATRNKVDKQNDIQIQVS